jgi:ribonucleoside-diphosphate reductase alpha chain
MISAVLRHGMPIPSVINLLDSLHLDGEFVGTWKAGVKRTLKRYIRDNETVKQNECPECNQNTLVFQDGCLTCTNCGYSKCG